MPRRSPIAIRLSALAIVLLGAAPAMAEGTSVPPYLSEAAAPQKEAAPAQAPAPKEAAPAAAAPEAAPPAGGQDLPALQQDTLFVELSTAGYYELAARARDLGLADSGNAEEIRARLYAYYGLKAPAAAEKGRTVTIERAGDASYAKVEEEEGGIVRASGGVILSLLEANGDSHRIQADSIVYNRARSTLTARGSVHYERKSGGSTEIFIGEALSADLNDWSGVFIDGKVRTAGEGKASGERGLVVAADTILRRSSNVMVLQNGVISSCDADDPHYAVRASRVWLLGDKEWAISNAVFSLGNVPILWLPFFYYPGDEIVFHPVVGYRSREGRFLQTTVYLVGAKPPKAQTTSLISFQGADTAKPTKLKGLFLQRVSGPPPPDLGTLKTMADVYSGLGGFAGIAGSFPKLGGLGKTELYAGMGRSRTLFPVGNATYSPYVYEDGYSSVWNSSDFLGLSMPLRYGVNLSTSFAAGGLTTSIALPVYSDPYFEQDFTNRTEDMDWFKMLGSTTDAATTTIATRSQLTPKIEATYSLKPKALEPWVSSIDVTRLTTYAMLLSKSSTAASLGEDPALFNYDPNRTFFYPSVFRPFDAALSLKGTLFNSSATPAAAKPEAKGKEGIKAELRSPWADSEGDKGEAPADTQAPAEAFRLPARAPDAVAGKEAAWGGSLGWTMTPSAYYEDSYLNANVNGPADIDYSRLYSLLSYKMAASLDGAVSYGDFLSSTLSLSYADQDQQRPYVYNDGSATALQAIQDFESADKNYKSRLVNETARLTLRPFASSWLWSGTSLSWGMVSTIYGYKYDSSSAAFKESWISWDPAMITSHDLSANLEVRPGDLKQSLTITATLPPVLESYSGKLALNAGFASLSTQSRMYRKMTGADFSFDPITTVASFGIAPLPILTDTYIWDTENSKPQSNVAGMTWGPLSASLTSTQTSVYKPVAGSGWVSYGGESFRFSSMTLGLAPQLKRDASASGGAAWSLGASLTLSQSLVRFTDSTLGANLSASFKATDSLTFTFSSQSLNSAAWRYFPGLFKNELAEIGRVPADYAVNPLADIWDSLSVWNGDTLRQSLFKLKSLSLKAAQDLHDWTLSAEVSTTPLYNATSQTYSLDTTFSILLAWKDVPDIKTTVTKASGTGLTY
jgi:hypothetical protein